MGREDEANVLFLNERIDRRNKVRVIHIWDVFVVQGISELAVVMLRRGTDQGDTADPLERPVDFEADFGAAREYEYIYVHIRPRPNGDLITPEDDSSDFPWHPASDRRATMDGSRLRVCEGPRMPPS